MHFNTNIDFIMESKFVARGGITGSIEEYDYCGLTNIDNIRTDLIFENINNIEVVAKNVGNSFIRGFFKDNIYTITVPFSVCVDTVWLIWPPSNNMLVIGSVDMLR